VTDRFGPATWIKVYAGQARELYVLGSSAPSSGKPAPSKSRYKAEEGSTNAGISQKENASGYAYVGGLV